MKLKKFFSYLIIVNITFLPLTAAAAKDPCEAEGAKYCSAYQGKDPRKYYCLQQIADTLSNGCNASLKKLSGTQSDFIEICTADYNKFCKDEVPGAGNIVKCLKRNSKKLDFDCRKKVSEVP